ncbi:MAG: hypothetical protein WBY01_15510, partial [Pseudolabrys sp.]
MIGILASFLSRDRQVPGDAGRGATSIFLADAPRPHALAHASSTSTAFIAARTRSNSANTSS